MSKYYLTTPMDNIWQLQTFYQETGISNITGAIFFDIPLKETLLGNTINEFIKNNSAMLFNIDKNKQITIREHHNLIFEVLDYHQYTNQQVDKLLTKRSQEAMDVTNQNLFEFIYVKRANDWGLYFKLSHLIADAWSVGLLTDSIINGYLAGLNNQEYQMLSSDYLKFIDSEQAYLNSERYGRDKTYFVDKFQEEPKLLSFHTGSNNKVKAKRKAFTLTKNETNKIKKYCINNKIAPGLLFEAALVTYMYRYFDEKQIILGMPVINRSNITEKQTMGMFISTMPLVLTVNENLTMKELLNNLSTEHFNLFKHQKFPFTEIKKILQEQHNYTNKLFDVTVSYQNTRTQLNDHLNISSQWYFNGASETSLVIHIMDFFDTGKFSLNFDYVTSVFTSTEINYIKRRVLTIINELINNDQQLISDIKIMDQAEYDLITNKFNDTKVEYDSSLTVVDLFKQAVSKTPKKTALIFEDKSYTYRELDQITDQVASKIQSFDLDKDSIIALFTERSQYTIFGMIGIMKAGYSYLPIDVNSPISRTEQLLKKLNISFSINYNHKLSNSNINQIDINNLQDTIDFQSPKIKPLDACCVLHTSGSTGEPKAVKLMHSNFVNIFLNYSDYLKDAKYVISNINVSFDPFVLETLYPILNNVVCVLTNNNESTNINQFVSILNNYNQTTVFCVPSKFTNILNETKDLSFIKNIKNIIIGGEHLNIKLVKKMQRINPNIQIYNSYGPNEATIFCTTGLIKNKIHIGKPIVNCQIFLCDKHHQLVPIGFPGEILVLGAGISAGYINNQQENQTAFISTENGITYKTGDIAKLDFDGNCYFLGRNDNQIKIRGQRIEIGDLENNVLTISGVTEAKVEVYEIDSKKHIRLYFTTHNNLTTEKLKQALFKKVPRYMIPTEIFEVEKFVVTDRGKYDFSKLKIKKSNINKSKKQPKNNLEKKLLTIFQKILSNSNIDIESDFFESGGDSLQAIALMNQIEKKLNINLQVKDVFDNSSVIAMAKFLSQKPNNQKHINNLLINEIEITKNNHPGKSILITGATGFLGMHILKYLLDKTDISVNIISRSEAKLIKLFKFYFNDDIKDYQNRIKIFIANITEEKLGLSDNEYETVKQTSFCIVNCAANVKHYGKLSDFYDINVNLVANLLKLAASADMIYNQLSTISVSGLGLCRQTKENIVFDEHSLDIGQLLEDNVYIETKYLAEVLTNHYKQVGLKVNVFRLGNIVERLSDHKFQINASSSGFQNRVKAIQKLGLITEEIFNMIIDLTYVDKVSEAIVKILLSNQYDTYHLYNFNEIKFGDYLISQNIKFKIVNNSDFQKAITESNDPAVSILKLYLSDFYKNKYDNIRVDSSKTIETLKKLNFDWSENEK